MIDFNSFGTLPVSKLDCNWNIFKFSSSTSSDGIVPVSLLVAKKIFSNESISPRVEGMVPDSSLLSKFSVTNDCRTLMLSGSLDWMEQLAKCKFWTFTRPVKDEMLKAVFKLLKLKSIVSRAVDSNRLGSVSPSISFLETFSTSIRIVTTVKIRGEFLSVKFLKDWANPP